MSIGNWLRRTFTRDRGLLSLSSPSAYMQGENPFGPIAVPEHWAATRQRHYERWLGPADQVSSDRLPLSPRIEISLHPPSPVRGRNFYTLITSGMSDLAMHLPEGQDPGLARSEIIMYIPSIGGKPAFTEPQLEVEMLRFMAHFPFEFGSWLAVGQTIPNGDPAQPVAPGSHLTTALFLPPAFEPNGFVGGLKLDSEPVNLLWLHPITTAEHQLVEARGYQVLLDLIQQRRGHPVLDLHRESLI